MSSYPVTSIELEVSGADPEALRTALAAEAAAQSVEHYEISRYGTLVTWAEQLGLKQAVRLLETTLDEEKNTDQALSALSETCVNQEAESEAA